MSGLLEDRIRFRPELSSSLTPATVHCKSKTRANPCGRLLAVAFAEDSGGVPDAVVAQLDVVSIAGLPRADRRPVPLRLAPTGHAVHARIHQVLIRPALGHHL